MERIIYETLSCRETMTHRFRKSYVAPQVLSVIPHEPVMAGAGSTVIEGGLSDTELDEDNNGNWAKKQDFFLPEGLNENSWE